jgi:hypothetical protein
MEAAHTYFVYFGLTFAAKHAALKIKSKDWFAWNQDNVSEWGDMHT